MRGGRAGVAAAVIREAIPAMPVPFMIDSSAA